MEWTAAIARAVINPRHGVYEAQENRKNRTYVCKSMDEIQQVLAEKGGWAFHGKNSSAA